MLNYEKDTHFMGSDGFSSASVTSCAFKGLLFLVGSIFSFWERKNKEKLWQNLQTLQSNTCHSVLKIHCDKDGSWENAIMKLPNMPWNIELLPLQTR